MSLTFWNDEVQAVVDRSSYQLCDKYAKVDYNDQLPIEITSLIGKKYTFKVSIDDCNLKRSTKDEDKSSSVAAKTNKANLSRDKDILDAIRSLTEVDDVRRNNALLIEKLKREDTDKIVVRIEHQLARDHGQFCQALRVLRQIKDDSNKLNLPL
ncbi:hypothetical protein Tco_0916985 [Tanacetum coccineum]